MALVWVSIGFFTGILLMHCLAAARIVADRAAGPAPKSTGGPSVGCLIRPGPREASVIAARRSECFVARRSDCRSHGAFATNRSLGRRRQKPAG
jgi:hypothetical protein